MRKTLFQSLKTMVTEPVNNVIALHKIFQKELGKCLKPEDTFLNGRQHWSWQPKTSA